MKTKLSLILGGMLLICQSVMAGNVVILPPTGGSQAYTVQANVPDATGITITASSVTTPGNVWSANNSTTLDFGNLVYTTPSNVFLPNHYFALDIAVQGAGTPDTKIDYSEGNNKNIGNSNGTGGLGTKSMITYAKEAYNGTGNPTETVLSSPYQPQTLISLQTTQQHIPSSQVSGGWLRTYLGICTGNAGTDASGCAPFTVKDNPGSYSGSLTFTVTVS